MAEVRITARKQTQGRGRRERSWLSEEGNLFMSLVFKTIDPASYPMRLAIACCELLKSYNPQIKWPNDILIAGKKVAGILGERVDEWMILGIGVNLNAKVSLPTAISLVELKATIDLKEFAQDLAEGFNEKVDLNRLNQYSIHKVGDLLTMKIEKERIDGTFLGFGDLGEIRLLVEGVERKFFSGEIV
jgi:BirA family biotin operon repressor/biotin-[acetyl-CoA-carboxylase] ligase